MSLPIPPPFRVKMVERISLLTPIQRREVLDKSGWNLLSIRAEDVYIDLLTDSGTGAMSDQQWSALMLGDEAHAGSRSFFRLIDCAKEIFGYPYVVPTHQGRGSEQILLPELVKRCSDRKMSNQKICPVVLSEGTRSSTRRNSTEDRFDDLNDATPSFDEGMDGSIGIDKTQLVFISNYHFDTTRAHIELAGARAVDVLTPEAFDTTTPYDWKGNFDIQKLNQTINDFSTENVAGIIATITCNSIGGQPASMKNLEEVGRIANRHRIPFIIDAARFAENAWFIKHRSPDFTDKTELKDVVLQIFSCADAMMFSGKKDGLGNVGGLCCIKSDEGLFKAVQRRCVLMEGHISYGGMSGRDMEALAVGLKESIDEDYLTHRIGQVEYLGQKLIDAGIPIQTPTGGHGVFIDAFKLLPNIPAAQNPAYALACELYLEGGVRAIGSGALTTGHHPTKSDSTKSDSTKSDSTKSDSTKSDSRKSTPIDLLRLAIPRRVYSNEHLDYVWDCFIRLKERSNEIRGLTFIETSKWAGIYHKEE